MKTAPAAVFDASAMALSGLCLIHCLALPLLASLLPLFGSWAQAEWVHGVFVAIAAPLTGYALWRAHRHRPLPRAMWLLAVASLACLLAGALGWPSETVEAPITVAGSLMLVCVHLWNALKRRHLHAEAAGDACEIH